MSAILVYGSQFQFIDWLCAIKLFLTSSNHIDRFSPWDLASTKHCLIWRWNDYFILYFSPPKYFWSNPSDLCFFSGQVGTNNSLSDSQSVLFLVCDVQANPIKMTSLDYETSLLAAASHCQLMFSLWSTKKSVFFWHLQLLDMIFPIPYSCLWFFLPKFRTLHLFLLKLILIVFIPYASSWRLSWTFWY